tara:strand:+ start:385 stop:975 length:591 start_codon:yes stop_codon:yes gene_type:complete
MRKCRKLFIIVIILFAFQYKALSEESNEIEIEGMSLETSLLNYFTKDQIEKHVMDYYKYIKKDPGKFIGVEFYPIPKESIFDAYQFTIKKNDKQFKLYMIKGMLVTESMEECKSKRNKFETDLKDLLINTERETDVASHEADSSGLSIVDSITYWFKNSDLLELDCYDWSEQTGNIDHLRIGIKSREFNDWLGQSY